MIFKKDSSDVITAHYDVHIYMDDMVQVKVEE